MKAVYSSESIAGNRQRGWRDVIGEIYADVDIEIPAHRQFLGNIMRTQIGHLEFTKVQTDTEIARRTKRHIAQAEREDFLFLQVKAGQLSLKQFGRECILLPGQFALIYLNAPFVFEHDGRMDKVAVKMPAQAISVRLSRVQDHCAIGHDNHAGIGRVLSSFIASVFDEEQSMPEASRQSIAVNTIDLIALACGTPDRRDAPGDSAARSAIRRRCLAYIDAHLADENLAPADISRVLGVSLRYLHQCFQSSEYSIGEYILKRRLEMCRRDLSDSRFAKLTISELAFRRGFRNAAHFSDSFRRIYDETPRAMRAAALG